MIGIDSSSEMLSAARRALPRDRVTLLEQDLDAPLPEERFELVISALAIHHLDAAGKAGLFRAIARHLAPAGRVVIGDVVIPSDPADAVIEIEPGYDFPSTTDEQVGWLRAAGLSARVTWQERDLAVISATG